MAGPAGRDGPRDAGVVVAVISAKGGSGTTFVAANLAHIIAGEARHSVALVELEPVAGQLQRFLRLTEPPLLPVLAALPRLSPEAVATTIGLTPGAVRVVAMPSDTPGCREPSADHAGGLLPGQRALQGSAVVELGHRLGSAETAVQCNADWL